MRQTLEVGISLQIDGEDVISRDLERMVHSLIKRGLSDENNARAGEEPQVECLYLRVRVKELERE